MWGGVGVWGGGEIVRQIMYVCSQQYCISLCIVSLAQLVEHYTYAQKYNDTKLGGPDTFKRG